MKTIMAKSSHDSFSFSRRYFNWKKKFDGDKDNDEEILTSKSKSSSCYYEEDKEEELGISLPTQLVPLSVAPARKHSVSKLKSALAVFSKSKSHYHSGLGTRIVGTLFGHRRGHVHFAFQEDPKLSPAFLIELATPTSILVREMASGAVRIALECEKKTMKKGAKLLEEPIWRTYCNGKKYGYATRHECGEEEWKVLKAVEPISMGAGVLPGSGNGDHGSEGELMYMRARFEKVVGSKDSVAFYMMNPEGAGGPELSIYLLRA